MFFKKIRLCHSQQHHAEFQKKLLSQYQEIFGTEVLNDGQILIHRALLVTVKCPMILNALNLQ